MQCQKEILKFQENHEIETTRLNHVLAWTKSSISGNVYRAFTIRNFKPCRCFLNISLEDEVKSEAFRVRRDERYFSSCEAQFRSRNFYSAQIFGPPDERLS